MIEVGASCTDGPCGTVASRQAPFTVTFHGGWPLRPPLPAPVPFDHDPGQRLFTGRADPDLRRLCRGDGGAKRCPRRAQARLRVPRQVADRDRDAAGTRHRMIPVADLTVTEMTGQEGAAAQAART